MAGQRFNAGQVSDWGVNPYNPGVYMAKTVGDIFPQWASFSNTASGAFDSRFSSIPIWIPNACTLTELTAYCSTLQADSTLRLGIYSSDQELKPVNLLADFGTVSGASTGTKRASGSLAILPGMYCLTAWGSATHSTVRWFSPNAIWNPFDYTGQIATNRSMLGYTAASVDYSGGFPATAPSVSLVNSATGRFSIAIAVKLS
jgi:hypothetical protein